jgi:hypothetical protein
MKQLLYFIFISIKNKTPYIMNKDQYISPVWGGGDAANCGNLKKTVYAVWNSHSLFLNLMFSHIWDRNQVSQT